MSVAVLVSSISGNTRSVAEAVASGLGATLTALEAPAVRPRFWSVISLGYAALFGGSTPVTLSGPDPTTADLIVLAAPVWAGRLSVPMRSWLATRPALPRRVALIMTGDAADGNPNALSDFAKHVGLTPEATLYVASDRVKAGSFAPDVAAFCLKLRSGDAAYKPLD